MPSITRPSATERTSRNLELIAKGTGVIALFFVMFLIYLALPVHRAQAITASTIYDQNVYFTRNGDGYGTKRFRVDDNGAIAYCLSPGAEAPEGGYSSSFTPNDNLVALLLRGYPSYPAPPGLTTDQWEETTQIAIWATYSGVPLGEFGSDNPLLLEHVRRLVGIYNGGPSEFLTTESPTAAAALPRVFAAEEGLWRCGPYTAHCDRALDDIALTIDDAPEGSFLGDEDGDPLESISSGMRFYLYLAGITPQVPSASAGAHDTVPTSVVTSSDGPLMAKVNVHAEGRSPAYLCWRPDTEGQQDVVVAESAQMGATETITIEWGELAFHKTSEDDLDLNRTFTLSGPSGTMDFVTDETGYWHSDPLLPGTYTVVETDTPERYVPQAAQSIEIGSDDVTSYTYTNELKRGSILLHKSSWVADDTTTFTFHILGRTHGDEREVAVTAKQPTLIDDLPIDTYTITEVSLDETRYIMPMPQEITLTNDTYDVTQEVTFDNKEALPKLEIEKIADDGADVAGTRFKVSGSNGWEGVCSIEKGQTSVKLDLPAKGRYNVTEIDVPARYLTPDSQDVDAGTGSTYELTFTNHMKPGIPSLLASIPHTGDDGFLPAAGIIALIGLLYLGGALLLMRGKRSRYRGAHSRR